MNAAMAEKGTAGKDYLWLNLRALPYFRAMLRAVEARFYRELDLPAPTLDLGCGDGHFATVAFERVLEAGLDPWAGPLREAARQGAYRGLVQGQGAAMPFRGGFFASAFSNSVLEHIPDIDAVLADTSRVLRSEAPFAFCVPNHNFDRYLSVGLLLDRLSLTGLADRYRRLFDRIARHQHLDPPEVWIARLERAGFRVERWWHYFSPAALRILEWGHVFGLPSLVARKLTGRWVIVPARWNLALTRRLVQPAYNEDQVQENGVCTFYIARRI
jgi:SAM-dependent methyltransferase